MKKKLYMTPLTTQVNVAITETMLNYSLTGTDEGPNKGGDKISGTAGARERMAASEFEDMGVEDLW